jgi:hypothetical protein
MIHTEIYYMSAQCNNKLFHTLLTEEASQQKQHLKDFKILNTPYNTKSPLSILFSYTILQLNFTFYILYPNTIIIT